MVVRNILLNGLLMLPFHFSLGKISAENLRKIVYFVICTTVREGMGDSKDQQVTDTSLMRFYYG